MRIIENLARQIEAAIGKLPPHMLPVDYEVALIPMPSIGPDGQRAIEISPILIFVIADVDLGKKIVTTTPVQNMFPSDEELVQAVLDIVSAMHQGRTEKMNQIMRSANGKLR
jgi:hypothetical protein